MTDELILHLGDFRTGTTTIQSWLRSQGAQHDIFYPPGFNHAALAHSLVDRKAQARQFRAMASLIAASKARYAVISAEHFEFSDPALLLKALAKHMPKQSRRLRLISYVRPHPQSFLARFSESAKIGSFDGDLDSYLDWPQTQQRMSYAPRFARWRAVFGEAFTLRLYDRSAFVGGDVLRDFVSFVIGTDPGPQNIEANASPGLEALSHARALHRAIGPLPPETNTARWTLGRHLGRQLAAKAEPQTPLRLDRALAQRLISTFQDDAASTDAAFFEGSPLKAALHHALETAQDTPQSLAPEDHLSADTLKTIALWGDMLRHGLTQPDGANSLNHIYHE